MNQKQDVIERLDDVANMVTFMGYATKALMDSQCATPPSDFAVRGMECVFSYIGGTVREISDCIDGKANFKK